MKAKVIDFYKVRQKELGRLGVQEGETMTLMPEKLGLLVSALTNITYSLRLVKSEGIIKIYVSG